MDVDYRYYLKKLGQACVRHQCDLHAYVLMTNHVHLLVTPHTETGIGKAMQMLGRYYVRYFNSKYQRTGTLWEGRYKATLVDSERYLLTCYRYIELNPVRAKGMVCRPGDYPWSSYRHNALGYNNDLITPHSEYMNLGSTSKERRDAYLELFAAAIADETLNEIREATNKAWVLGSSAFREKIETQANRRLNPLVKGGDRKSEAYQNRFKINRI